MSTSILSFQGKTPRISESAYLAPGVRLSGDIQIGDQCSLWFNVSARGDVGSINIEEGCNIQDNSVIHVSRGCQGVKIGKRVTIGHSVIIHECQIEDLCLVGMGAIILDHVQLKKYTFVAAGAVVTPGSDFPSESLLVGSPARVKRKLSKTEIENIEKSAQHYIQLAQIYKDEQPSQ